MTGVGLPPPAAIRYSGPSLSGAKTTVPSRFQVPPRPSGASHRLSTGPPIAETLLTFRSEKKPMDLPSADQNG